ncbi:MAG: coproporphyrinogen III oxidase family protein [Oscillospiraceae bacterium]|nr:coproporphyrinogen III oxidase family protein [Oscillospiraceae bacterium]
MLGLYIHVPFCVSKCTYCDFYSIPLPDEEVLDAYADAVRRALDAPDVGAGKQADTLYFGGGTPSLLGARRLTKIIDTAAEKFGLHGAEITLEVNPGDNLTETLSAFVKAGGNRVSVGMQAADDKTLRWLGRRHAFSDVKRAISDVFHAGINNFSLDLLLGVAGQTSQTVQNSAAFCQSAGASHVSAYILKIESGVPFCHPLPEEDTTASLYLSACDALESLGFIQYEISNFSVPGAESRHNLKYWRGEDVLAIGPAAHGFTRGVRWAYPRDLEYFLKGGEPLPEPVSSLTPEEERAMLRLRLTEGLPPPVPEAWMENAKRLPRELVRCDGGGIRLTREGFLLSNTVIEKILWG